MENDLQVLWLFAISLVVLFIAIYFVQRMFFRFLIRVRADISDRKGIERKMKQIEEMLDVDSETSWRLAVIEADKLLDYGLKELMFMGSSFHDRLKLASAKFRRIRPVFEAHRLRNRLVHETASLSRSEAKRAVSLYRSALKELGVL